MRRPPLSSNAMQNILPTLIADGPEALIELCGVNLLERLLRILQRLEFRRAIVFSTTPEIIRDELAKLSWPREQIPADVVSSSKEQHTEERLFKQSAADRCLIVPANICCDARLLAA